jgi:hypothetical protein
LQKDADGVYAVRSQNGEVEQVSLFADLKDARNRNLAIAEQRRRRAIGNDVTASSALLVDDLYKALDDPAAHKEWLSLARRMAADEPAAAYFMAETMAHSLRSRARAAKGDDLIELEQRLSPSGDLTAKFRALGVTPRAQKEPGQRIRTDRDRLARADRDVARPYDQRQPRFSAASDNMDAREANALTPRGRQTPEDSPGIAFSEEDSLKLVEALNRARRVNYIPPSTRTGPLLATRAEPGFKWSNPLVGDAGVSMAGYMAGKFAPGVVEQAIHGGGVTYLPEELMEFANADPRRRPRWAAPLAAYG